MELIIQLFILCSLFFIFLRYDLGLSYSKCISRSVLFTIFIGLVYLIYTTSYKENFGYSTTYEDSDTDTDTDTDTDDETDMDDETDTDDDADTDDNADTTSSKKKKKKKN
jgi:hypothetical protein